MSEEEVKELEEWSEETEEAWEEVEEEQPPLYVAIALLTRGSHFIYPGETVELEPETAEVLISKGKVRPLGEQDG